MRVGHVRLALAGSVAVLWLAGVVRLPSEEPRLNWYKGNLHTHTINSDGDSAPDVVARWYKEQRYHFLALTDHNYLTDPQGLNAIMAATDRFLLITGEEVTSRYLESPVHVNAFRLRETIQPAFGDSIAETLQDNIDRIRDAGAVPSLNHPFFRWAIEPEVFRQVRGLKLFEVFNGIADTNDGWGLEEMWDDALTAGQEIYGIAVDDAHEFKQFAPDRSNPGRGWVEVRARRLSQAAILEALDQGDFYASTGIKLETLERGDGRLRIRVAQKSDERHRIRFIGRGGRVLSEISGLEGEYRLKPGDGYVRATITDSYGWRAWVQPVFGG